MRHAADRAAEEGRATFRILDANRRPGRGSCLRSAGLQAASALPIPAAARSRAMPRTPMQSWRLGVTRDVEHRIVEPRIIERSRVPTGASAGSSMMPVMLLAQLQLAHRAHHAAALDAADRGDLQRHVAAGDVSAGRRRTRRAFRRGHWARRTRPGSPRRRPHRRSAPAACRPAGASRRSAPWRRVNGASASAGLLQAPRPPARSRSASRRSLRPTASVSRCSFSHDSENFMRRPRRDSVGTSSARKP